MLSFILSSGEYNFLPFFMAQGISFLAPRSDITLMAIEKLNALFMF
jgi:hypothetical protein